VIPVSIAILILLVVFCDWSPTAKPSHVKVHDGVAFTAGAFSGAHAIAPVCLESLYPKSSELAEFADNERANSFS